MTRAGRSGGRLPVGQEQHRARLQPARPAAVGHRRRHVRHGRRRRSRRHSDRVARHGPLHDGRQACRHARRDAHPDAADDSRPHAEADPRHRATEGDAEAHSGAHARGHAEIDAEVHSVGLGRQQLRRRRTLGVGGAVLPQPDELHTRRRSRDGVGCLLSPGGSGIAPLVLDAGISDTVSRPYAKLLATTAVCSHFDGGNPGDRLRTAGYTSYRWAENLG